MPGEVISGTTAAPLTALDRCDRCGAQAYVVYSMNVGGELMFCAHHAQEFGPDLVGRAVLVVNELEKLSS